jgi:hypothetical protein
MLFQSFKKKQDEHVQCESKQKQLMQIVKV